MGLFGKIFKKSKEDIDKIEIVSRTPVGRFRVLRVFQITGRQVLSGEVIGGVIYPGYKLKGKDVGVIMAIERQHKRVDFAISGDTVALILENNMKVEKGEVLEVYQS
ncbi:MAG: translation factor [Thermococcus sp.]|uniref:tRNA-binding protein Pbp11 n=1 Tax=Thermococcus sp. TaxID=35749 RepID=UPI001DA78146|nr:tRNA-binding protein Pbp11 [Thermococcus sp.]MBO8174770.1 translation factor [Thermococcus sp.]